MYGAEMLRREDEEQQSEAGKANQLADRAAQSEIFAVSSATNTAGPGRWNDSAMCISDPRNYRLASSIQVYEV